jgi:hypothetical protein
MVSSALKWLGLIKQKQPTAGSAGPGGGTPGGTRITLPDDPAAPQTLIAGR